MPSVFETIGGGNSPMFLSYQRSGGLDISPAIKYADFKYQAKKAAEQKRPKLESPDIKDAISQDMAVVEEERQQGIREMEEIFSKYGNNYDFAMTDPAFKQAYAKINTSPVEILQLKEHKEKAEDFWKQTVDNAAGNQAFTQGKGYMGAIWDPNKKDWIRNTDAISSRYYDPSWNFKNAPDLVMTSDFSTAKDAQEEIKGLFDKVGISTFGSETQGVGSIGFNAVPGDPSTETSARLLQSVYTSGGSNVKGLEEASSFFAENISQKSIAGLWNEFIDSPEYISKFSKQIKDGTFNADEAKKYFRDVYVPNYITDLAKAYVQTKSDKRISSQILSGDVSGDVANKMKVNALSLYAGASPAIFGDLSKTTETQNIVTGVTIKDGKRVATLTPVFSKTVAMDEKTKDFYNDIITKSKNSDGNPTLPAGYFGKAGISSLGGSPVNLQYWFDKYGAKVHGITGQVVAMPLPNMKNGQFDINNMYDQTPQKDGDGNMVTSPKNPFVGFMPLKISISEDVIDDILLPQMNTDTGEYTYQDLEESWFLGDFAKDNLLEKGILQINPNNSDEYLIEVKVPINPSNALDLVNPFQPSSINFQANQNAQTMIQQQQQNQQINKDIYDKNIVFDKQ
jgi:hypothetical protein